MKKKADQIEEAPPVNGIEVLTITSLDQLQRACEETFHVKAVLPSPKGVRVVLIPVRLLRPDESERLELIVKDVNIPMKPVPQPDGTSRMEYVTDKETNEKIARAQRVARAMALWWACPLFRESEDGKKAVAISKESDQRAAIFDLVQSKFTETILEKLYTVIRAQEFHLEERVNFTTPPA